MAKPANFIYILTFYDKECNMFKNALQEFEDANLQERNAFAARQIVLMKKFLAAVLCFATVLAFSIGVWGYETKLIAAPYYNQKKEYKTACESISAVMALQSFGFDITPNDFIDGYLVKSPMNSFNPNKAFGGDPYTINGLGCYAPVIEDAVNRYLLDVNANYVAKTVKGVTLEYLRSVYVDQGVPVILWATSGMREATQGFEYILNGKPTKWITPEHCLLWVGYDGNYYLFHDPEEDAYTRYDKEKVKSAYKALGSQSVVIVPKNFVEKPYIIGADVSSFSKGQLRQYSKQNFSMISMTY